MTALINQGAPSHIGFFLPKLYQNPQLLRDITQGNNNPTNSNLGYPCGPGWDACADLRVPIGAALFEFFADPCLNLYNQVNTLEAELVDLNIALDSGEIPPPPRTPQGVAQVMRYIHSLEVRLAHQDQLLQQCRQAHPGSTC